MTIDTWIGVDETVISTGGSSLIVVASSTHNPALATNLGYRKLKKSKDILKEAGAYSRDGVMRAKGIPEFPSFEEMTAAGLDHFHWVKANPGRFCRAMIEHAAIAYTLLQNGYNPNTTKIMIDAFYNKHEHTQQLIHRYLCYSGFNIPLSHIEVYGWGDQSVPIINYSDLLAFQIGLKYNSKYSQYGQGLVMELSPSKELDFDTRRIIAPLRENERELLEQVIAEVDQ